VAVETSIDGAIGGSTGEVLGGRNHASLPGSDLEDPEAEADPLAEPMAPSSSSSQSSSSRSSDEEPKHARNTAAYMISTTIYANGGAQQGLNLNIQIQEGLNLDIHLELD
jgi:hypothetical protein